MDIVDLQSLASGVAVGIALGLTGGGGSIFAVPLLVYVIGTGVREAVGISLAAVGATALFGAISRWRSGQVEARTGMLFAAAGMLGAPVGAQLGAHIPPAATLAAFAFLMVLVAVRMWRNQAGANRPDNRAATCQRDPHGELRWTSRCALVLALVGFLTGVFSGVFGVGGGFIIVPALILTTRMAIHHAVGTSLVAITLIAASGVASYLASGATIPLGITGLFVAGGISGMAAGNLLAARLSGPVLNKVFAVSIAAVAAFVLGRSIL